MKLDLTKPYQTRDGREAWAVAPPKPITSSFMSEIRFIGYIEGENGRKAYGWAEDGKNVNGTGTANDLVNIAETRAVKLFINVYEDHVAVHNTAADARVSATVNRIAYVERGIIYNVGEGLDQ